MYHQHFGLSGAPFQFTPTPSALYLSKTHREGLAALEWSLLHEPSGFTLLVGESGDRQDHAGLLDSGAMLRERAQRLRHQPEAELRSNDADRDGAIPAEPRTATTSSRLIEGFTHLLDDLRRGERLVIIIDEAQELADETLEEFEAALKSRHGRRAATATAGGRLCGRATQFEVAKPIAINQPITRQPQIGHQVHGPYEITRRPYLQTFELVGFEPPPAEPQA